LAQLLGHAIEAAFHLLAKRYLAIGQQPDVALETLGDDVDVAACPLAILENLGPQFREFLSQRNASATHAMATSRRPRSRDPITQLNNEVPVQIALGARAADHDLPAHVAPRQSAQLPVD
jgi:hypothetical protein